LPKPTRWQAAHREGDHHAAGISREDFRGASDVSGNFKAETALTQMNGVELKRRQFKPDQYTTRSGTDSCRVLLIGASASEQICYYL
jgi:hypothetical protein